MKILHTSDWHLGKNLESFSRIEEQELFIDELEKICDEESIDFIIVAGDIYDTVNPPAIAENLFYKALVRLSNKGERPILIISGNHDSPVRLSASNPIIREIGIIMVDTPKTVVKTGDRGNYKIVKSGEGFFEMELNGENLVALNMPYPSEARLNELISDEIKEEFIQLDYTKRIGEIFRELEKNYRKDTINIATGHFFVNGGKESGSERNIQIGGSLAIFPEDLPDAQYIALGHLHGPQRTKHKNAYYSGSPIEYSRSEAGKKKSVYIIDIEAGKEAEIKQRELTNYKPIEIWEAESIEEAIEMCENRSEDNIWVYLDIYTNRLMENSEIRKIRSLRKDILYINTILEDMDIEEYDETREYTMEEDFHNFFVYINGTPPSPEILELFLDIYRESEEADETD